MYLIRFGRVAIFVQESRKISRKGMTRIAIETPSDEAWKALCLKDPYARCRKLDWFLDGNRKGSVPGYAADYAKSATEAMAEIDARERDRKIEEIIGDAPRN